MTTDCLYCIFHQSVNKLVFSMAIFSAETRNQNFGQAIDENIRIRESSEESPILRNYGYNLQQDFATATIIVLVEIKRKQSSMKLCNRQGSVCLLLCWSASG